MVNDKNKLNKWKSLLVSVFCPINQQAIKIGWQEFLKDKTIKAIFQTGNTVGRNNENITTTDFWIDLYQDTTIIEQWSANMLNFSTNHFFIELNVNSVDFQNSLIFFPAPLGANTTVELIVFYE